MRFLVLFVLVLASCSAPNGQKEDDPGSPTPVSNEALQMGKGEGTSSATPSGGGVGELPYLAVRKASGPSLQALMRGRLEVQGDCVVFVEPGAKPRLAVFHPPAALRREGNGNLVVVSDIFEIAIGRDIRAGGGALPPGEDLNAALRAPVADRCPAQAVEIGELVQ
jgi:hypothetical protein